MVLLFVFIEAGMYLSVIQLVEARPLWTPGVNRVVDRLC
jgi:hypothetical protein